MMLNWALLCTRVATLLTTAVLVRMLGEGRLPGALSICVAGGEFS